MKDKDSEILKEICETSKPLLDLILSRFLVTDKRLNEKQKKLIRNKPYIWGYINTLVDNKQLEENKLGLFQQFLSNL